MNKPMRQGYPDIPSAIAGGILQIEKAKLVGFAVSVHDANLRHVAACNAMARSAAKHREMMDRLRGNMTVETLSPKDLASRVYPKRRY